MMTPDRPDRIRAPREDKVFEHTDGAIHIDRPKWPDDELGRFDGHDRLNHPFTALGTAPQPPDQDSTGAG